MARALKEDDERPLPDQIEGAPHPSQTNALFGQAAAEADFLEAFTTGRMHSGWLITGPRGVGKATLAWRIAGFLLSQPMQADDDMFGAPPPPATLDVDPDHPDIRLLRAGAHPRLFIVRRALNATETALQEQITMAALRGHKDGANKLMEFLHQSATDGGRRVVIIDAADEMNPSVANSILKVLEEPPRNTYFLLVSHQPSRLLPTIRSRCRLLRCGFLGTEDVAAALAQAEITLDGTEALAALSGGSVGEAIRLTTLDGLTLYSDLVSLFNGLPKFDRPRAIRMADSCTGKTGATRFALMLDLIDIFLTRVARAGVEGPPAVQAAPGEALLLARLSPHDHAARIWATLAQEVSERTRHGKAVNLDPAALILDTLFRIEQTARDVTPV
ncbi:DNA polymerase III subunit delta' [Thalassorhabdomicrobium marinisediminis]|uniref:DNA polymerase III subunit delta n=1 Tax=Thalassorhabdomicrobium marinisediminis TaxID=2170577 RepID=A0A2T7FWH2_9RHOB|nr:DNA polymerase III subunit delta' [Thalassorhabdomicrobium marinisediminis]PVA06520.1 DNA polymerase III subunit delta' [Thalassorhabdomicrobium marinisediminis]